VTDSKPVRVQLELTPRSHQRLQAMRDRTEAASYADVVRQALRLYEYLVGIAERGASFHVKDGDQPAREVQLFLAEPPATP
jgi:hypothetical protein